MKRASTVKEKTFFIIFKGLSFRQIKWFFLEESNFNNKECEN